MLVRVGIAERLECRASSRCAAGWKKFAERWWLVDAGDGRSERNRRGCEGGDQPGNRADPDGEADIRGGAVVMGRPDGSLAGGSILDRGGFAVGAG